MFLKADWKNYLHGIRKQELDIVFSFLGSQRFSSALEVGAGDGYQTGLLAERCGAFISTDLNFGRIKEELKVPKVLYKQCDADKLEGVFEPEQFDLIFSSNLIEHLSDPSGFLFNTKTFLTSGGYGIHVVPGRLIKLSYLALHYLNLFALVVDRFIGLFQKKEIFRGSRIYLENNLNLLRQEKRGRLKKILFPPIHGNFRSHQEEFVKFGKKEWEKLFREAGFDIKACLRGPVFSGYGFSFGPVSLLEKIGLASEHIFIIQKN